MIMTEKKNQSTDRKTCSNTAFSTTNHTGDYHLSYTINESRLSQIINVDLFLVDKSRQG